MAVQSAFTDFRHVIAPGRSEGSGTRGGNRHVSPAALALILIGGLLIDQILLWRFLGWISDLGALALSLGACGGLIRVAAHLPMSGRGPGLRVLGGGFAVALAVFMLGGEGRFFYATADWQVRGAVLRDLTLYPWPYLYADGDARLLLRAPIGIYLAPALVGKLAGLRAAEIALLLQNSAMLAILFGLGATLFGSARARWRAVVVFLAFSGMDAVGQLLAAQPLTMNAERWVMPVFSAHITQAFWVPQHALAGWSAAILFLLWREGKLPPELWLSAVPLLALWSPLAAMGAMPFAALTIWEAARRREVTRHAIGWPALASLIAAPGLAYLATGSAEVGSRPLAVPFNHYVLFELLEVGPYLLALAFAGWRGRFGGRLLVTFTAILLAMPFVQIGQLGDFAMRASIPALAVLAIGVADLLDRPVTDRLWPRLAMGALAIGAITPAFEIWRALVLPRAPAILCSYLGVVPGGYNTYVAAVERVPVFLAPNRATSIRPRDPATCWDGPWPGPILFADGGNG